MIASAATTTTAATAATTAATAATEAPTATATAATTAAAATTTATTAAGGALLGFVDSQGTSVEISAVHGRHRAFGFGARAHGHEAEAARLPRHPIRHQMNVDDLAMRGEGLAKRVLGGVEGQVTYVQTISHDAFSILAPEVVRLRRASDEGDLVRKAD